LYQAFGWEPPQFAHLPLILNEKRQKLSKREGTGSVSAWLDKGILPQALINYVALLGWHPSDEREFFAFEDLVQAFDLSRVGRAGAVFDAAKLEWLCGEHLKSLSTADIEKIGRPYLRSTEFSDLSSERLLPLIEVIRQGLARLDQLPHKLEAFSSAPPQPDEEALTWLNSDAAKTALPQILSGWRALSSPDADALLAVVRELGKKLGVKGKDLWMPLRAAITGRVAGPELKIVMAHLGAQEVITRLERILGQSS
jgi:glutamyl/glutaminyl-tRNA synthetase